MKLVVFVCFSRFFLFFNTFLLSKLCLHSLLGFSSVYTWRTAHLIGLEGDLYGWRPGRIWFLAFEPLCLVRAGGAEVSLGPCVPFCPPSSYSCRMLKIQALVVHSSGLICVIHSFSGLSHLPAYTSVGSRALPPAHGTPRQRVPRHGDHGREKAWPRRGFEPLHTGVVCRCLTTEPPEALGAALPPYSKCSSVLRTEPPAFKLDTISIEIAAYLVLLEAVDLNSSLTMAGKKLGLGEDSNPCTPEWCAAA